MSLPKVKRGGSFVAPAGVRVKAGSWIKPKSMWLKVEGAWQRIWNSLEFQVGLQSNKRFGSGETVRQRSIIPIGSTAGNSYAYYLTATSEASVYLNGNTAVYTTMDQFSPTAYISVECVVTGPDAGSYSISFEITG